MLYEVILSDLEQVLKDMSWKAPGLVLSVLYVHVLLDCFLMHSRSITGQKNGFVKLAAAVFHQVFVSEYSRFVIKGRI